MLWLDNDIRERSKRLWIKLTGSPFFPLLVWSKFLESYIAGGEWMVWIVPTLFGTAFYIVSEDLREYLNETGDDLHEALSNSDN